MSRKDDREDIDARLILADRFAENLVGIAKQTKAHYESRSLDAPPSLLSYPAAKWIVKMAEAAGLEYESPFPVAHTGAGK